MMQSQPMIRFRTLFLLAVFCLSAITLKAQEEVIATSSNGTIDGSHLKPYSNKWKVYGVDQNGNKTLQRLWTDYVQSINIDGVDYLSRTQELYGPEMNLQEVWTNLFEHQSMLPKRASQMRTNGTYLYQEFEGSKVKVTQKQDGQEANETIHTYAATPFDWTLYGVLLSGLPLKTGSKGAFPTVNFANPGTESKLGFTVLAKEQLTTEDGRKFQTLKVETDRGLTFWLAKKAPYVIQLELKQGESQKILWVMY